ncbi:hypothetical protein [uncultured Polaribacter sp.]|uniref:hypothetical protein n=1 Tax=uncultured Polaribacter sp. TaxID=174711 RepID=UPI00260AB002|nr:hypothetical protein [uncultured Polaribacter sp.]
MENNFEKITNIQLHISNDCSEEHKKIIETYWKLDGTETVNKPMFVKDLYNITQGVLTNIVSTYSSITLYIYCQNCNSYEKDEATSQYAFTHVLKGLFRKYHNPFLCTYCREQHREFLKLENIRKREQISERLNTAIEAENWQNLSLFEKEVLYSCLGLDFNELNKYYWDTLGKKKHIQFINAIKNIENQGLLVLERNDWNNYIMDYEYSPKLFNYKEEISQEIDKETNRTNAIDHDKETNTIKLKLTVNEYQNHPDSPTFSGIVKFPKKIVIEPNVEYIFGHWQRANDNLYLTLTPKTDLEKLPTQKRISKLPIPIKKGITDFLNNMGEEYSF